jgi:hypothetical protein
MVDGNYDNGSGVSVQGSESKGPDSAGKVREKCAINYQPLTTQLQPIAYSLRPWLNPRTAINFFIVVFLFLFSTAAVGAQDLKSMQNLYQVVRTGMLKFRVVSGRMSLDDSRIGNIQTANNFGKQQDMLSVQSAGGDTVLTYSWSDGKQQLFIEASNVSKVRIRFLKIKDDLPAPVEFMQPLQGKTVLKVGPEDKQQVYSGSSLWHLFLAYPAETKQHLVPLLELVHPNWKLPELASAVESELIRKAGRNDASDRQRWAELVGQLGDESFAKRQTADRAIRTADPAVLNYLQQLDFSKLDAEQRFRIRRIIEDLSERLGDDSPDQVASWLSDDASIWLILLSRPEAATRRKAAGQLATLLGESIGVDPEAEPATQKTQIEELRKRIEK